MKDLFTLDLEDLKVANFTPIDQKFEIGKGVMLNLGSDVTIVATGHLVWEAIKAREELDKMGISAEIINIHTIKPLDSGIILKSTVLNWMFSFC